MIKAQAPQPIREAVGVFHSAETMQAAIDELLASGFDRAELSLLAAEETVVEKLGLNYRKVTALEDAAEAPRTAWISTESLGDAEGALIGAPLYIAAVVAAGAIVASGGSLAAAIAGAALAGGAGGTVGALLAGILGDRQAKAIEEQLEQGGLLLWVRTFTPADEERAVDILKRHCGEDVHLHEIMAG
jgi:hypothetical protein